MNCIDKFSARSIEINNVFHAQCVCTFYTQNIEALHGINRPLETWINILDTNSPDEQNFLIYQFVTPVAWLRMDDLRNINIAWIGMLVVGENFQGQGVGQFAISFAEDFAKRRGVHMLGIHTTEDNVPALNLYKKCGYIITEYGDCTTGDGVSRKGYTLKKDI